MVNLKNQILIFLYLVLMILSVFFAVYISVIEVYWLLKILVSLFTLTLTIYLFILMKKTNKKLVYVEKTAEIVEKDTKQVVTNKMLCPKCYHPYDGHICFICGYNTDENITKNTSEN